jgi:hypothetical protein
MELEAERDRLNTAIAALQGSKTKQATRPLVRGVPSIMRTGRRRLSAAARKKISDAQKARWAKRKKAA